MAESSRREAERKNHKEERRRKKKEERGKRGDFMCIWDLKMPGNTILKTTQQGPNSFCRFGVCRFSITGPLCLLCLHRLVFGMQQGSSSASRGVFGKEGLRECSRGGGRWGESVILFSHVDYC